MNPRLQRFSQVLRSGSFEDNALLWCSLNFAATWCQLQHPWWKAANEGFHSEMQSEKFASKMIFLLLERHYRFSFEKIKKWHRRIREQFKLNNIFKLPEVMFLKMGQNVGIKSSILCLFSLSENLNQFSVCRFRDILLHVTSSTDSVQRCGVKKLTITFYININSIF